MPHARLAYAVLPSLVFSTGLAVLTALAGCASVAAPASARTLSVGPQAAFRRPSQAIASAGAGDTVLIQPGTYYDCAVVHANNVTIAGAGPGVVLTDTTCQGKAILVTAGNNITVRNLTLQRARVADGNGAGIRAEGTNLTIDGVRFLDNQDGILSADNPASTIRITNSDFERNGTCDHGCAHGIYANSLKLLDIEHTRFFDQHVGHHIKSRAAQTVLIDDSIEDGPNGTASYLVDISNGGGVLMQGCTLEKGPNAQNHSTAVTIGEEGVNQPTPSLIFRDNHFTNDMAYPTLFVRNLTATPAQLIGNVFKGQIKPLEGDGSVR